MYTSQPLLISYCPCSNTWLSVIHPCDSFQQRPTHNTIDFTMTVYLEGEFKTNYENWALYSIGDLKKCGDDVLSMESIGKILYS